MLSTLRGLTYRPPGTTDSHGHTETKSGAYLYDGNPAELNEWTFRTLIKLEAIKPDEEAKQKKSELASKVVEGLRDEAMRVARETPELMTEKGVETLIKNMDTTIIPRRKQEAERLYQAGTKTWGPLTRQRKEPMTSYVGRRKRWWLTVKDLDS